VLMRDLTETVATDALVTADASPRGSRHRGTRRSPGVPVGTQAEPLLRHSATRRSSSHHPQHRHPSQRQSRRFCQNSYDLDHKVRDSAVSPEAGPKEGAAQSSRGNNFEGTKGP
jgi:hypothetical protein